MSNDADIFDRVLTYVTDFSTAVDIGAHKGIWSERMANRFDKLYCFEPNPLLYIRLCNWAVCTHCKIEIYNIAISNIDGMSALFYNDGYEYKSRSHYAMQNCYGSIEMRRLDSFRIRDCGLLKVDVEGGELQVLQGARRMLRHQKPVVVVEHKPLNSIRFGWKLSNLLFYMRELQYRLAFRDEPNLVFVR